MLEESLAVRINKAPSVGWAAAVTLGCSGRLGCDMLAERESGNSCNRQQIFLKN